MENRNDKITIKKKDAHYRKAFHHRNINDMSSFMESKKILSVVIRFHNLDVCFLGLFYLVEEFLHVIPQILYSQSNVIMRTLRQ